MYSAVAPMHKCLQQSNSYRATAHTQISECKYRFAWPGWCTVERRGRNGALGNGSSTVRRPQFPGADRIFSTRPASTHIRPPCCVASVSARCLSCAQRQASSLLLLPLRLHRSSDRDQASFSCLTVTTRSLPRLTKLQLVLPGQRYV